MLAQGVELKAPGIAGSRLAGYPKVFVLFLHFALDLRAAMD